MKVFLDANVIIDFITKRNPDSAHAAPIFSGQKQNEYKLYTSSINLVNVAHVIKTTYKVENATQVVEKISRHLTALPTSQQALKKSFASNFKDFEDAAQYFTALEARTDLIVTRDRKGFKESETEVLNPYQFVTKHLN